MSHEPHIYFDEVNERQGMFHRRTVLLGGFAGLGLAALGFRLSQLQLVETGRYQTLSKSNQFNFRLVPPPRGRILDREGVEIASNRPEFRILLQRDVVEDVDAAIDNVAALIPISDAKRRQITRDIAQTPRSSPVAIATDLTWDEFSRINVRMPELPGITAEMGEARFYPFPGAFSHVIGYVSRVSAKDIEATGEDPPPLLLHPGFRIGKQGVEKSLDLQLRGKPGGHKVEVDSVGRVIREDPAGDIQATPGDTIKLTLDADIQNRAMDVMGMESGAAVMIDCRNGDILCLASNPSFDANAFVKGVPGDVYADMVKYERKPLFNKALTANYAPGSTYKTMVTLAALEHGYDPKTVHVCNRSWSMGNHTWHCDQVHGACDMRSAIKKSCDVYFFATAMAIGPDRIAEVARRFGLGETFDIGIPGQKPGIVPDTEWKRTHVPHDPKWHPGDTPSIGIGQGFVSVNALQLATMCARIANGGTALQPRLIHSVGDEVRPSGADAPRLGISPEHIDFLRSAMNGVVNEPGGTAFGSGACKLDLGPVVMAGKSGTAQAHTYAVGSHGIHGSHGQWVQRDHAWFIAYAPSDAPRYAVAVLVEHGGFGAETSAPKAREIMKIALLKDPEVRARIEQPLDRPPQPQQPAANQIAPEVDPNPVPSPTPDANVETTT
ncbi:penicillin-binding protein 2 [Caulobacter sp. S45]|uniref:penicillin-binding protein 2 n=1 Tax=Caulobacter sp. S45 TaxID=1641861 RepID=UPI0020B16DED|nr:penicillin-binding protein 2 [Caulobacter sp. S45]